MGACSSQLPLQSQCLLQKKIPAPRHALHPDQESKVVSSKEVEDKSTKTPPFISTKHSTIALKKVVSKASLNGIFSLKNQNNHETFSPLMNPSVHQSSQSIIFKKKLPVFFKDHCVFPSSLIQDEHQSEILNKSSNESLHKATESFIDDESMSNEFKSKTTSLYKATCCYCPTNETCPCQLSPDKCERNKTFPSAPPIIWDALLSFPLHVSKNTEVAYREILFSRFCVAVSFYCCNDMYCLDNDIPGYWYRERQKLRTCLYYGEKFLNESYTLLSSGLTAMRTCSFPTLPSYGGNTNFLNQSIPEYGGIEGPSLIPSEFRGHLVGFRSTASKNNVNGKRSFGIVYELEPLCCGLLWKRTIQTGKGWRRPDLRSLVTLRYSFLASSLKKDSFNTILENSQNWNSITLSSFHLPTFHEIYLARNVKEKKKFQQTLFNFLKNQHSIDNICGSLFFPFLQSLIHSMIVLAKTMTQDEVASLSSPFFNLVFPKTRDSVSLLVCLESWASVIPFTEKKSFRAPCILILKTLYRTFEFSSSPTRDSKLIYDEVSLFDIKPSLQSFVTIQLKFTLNDALDTNTFSDISTFRFQINSGSMPEAFDTALTNFTVGSYGEIWIPFMLTKNTILLPILKKSLNLEYITDEQIIYFHVKLLNIESLQKKVLYKKSNFYSDIYSPQDPALNYIVSLQSLAKLDTEFFSQVKCLMKQPYSKSFWTSKQIEKTTDINDNKLSEIVCPYCNKDFYSTVVHDVRNLIDECFFSTNDFNLHPSLDVLGEKTDLQKKFHNLSSDCYFPKIAMWKYHSNYKSKWTQYQLFSRLTHHDMFLQTHTSPLVVLGLENVIWTTVFPHNSYIGMCRLSKRLSHFTSDDPLWNNALNCLIQPLKLYFNNSVYNPPDVCSTIVRKISNAPVLSQETQALSFLHPNTSFWSLVALPSTISLWPSMTSDNTSSIFEILNKKIQDAVYNNKSTVENAFCTKTCIGYKWNLEKRTVTIFTENKQPSRIIDDSVFLLLKTLILIFCNLRDSRVQHEDNCSAKTFMTNMKDEIIDSLYADPKLVVDSFLENFSISISVDPPNILHKKKNELVFVPSIQNTFSNSDHFIPSVLFIQGLRQQLYVFENLVNFKTIYSSLSPYLTLFLNRWPGYLYFGDSMAAHGYLETLCSDLLEHLKHYFISPVANSLLTIIYWANKKKKNSCFYLCAPLAAVIIIKRLVSKIDRFLSRVKICQNVEKTIKEHVTSLLKMTKKLEMSEHSEQVFSFWSLCFAFDQQQYIRNVKKTFQYVLQWAAKFFQSDILTYLFQKTEEIQYNGLSYSTALKLCLPRKCFFHSLFSKNTSTNPISRPKIAEEVLEQFFFSILNYGPLDESLRRRLTLWSKSVTSENIYAPTSDGLHVYWSTLQCMNSGNLLHPSLIDTFYIFLTIFAFNYVIAFDPWLGFFTSSGIMSATQHEKNDTTLSASYQIPSMTNWFEAATWFEPLLLTLNNIIISPDEHNLDKTKMFFPENIKAMLYITNALFLLYTYGDYKNFSKFLYQTFNIASKMPPFSMFSCFSLIALNYLRGGGQEETHKTQMLASYFRYTRRTWPLTPFHIGLPDCCPANLIPFQLQETWSIMKERFEENAVFDQNFLLNETLDVMGPAKNTLPVTCTKIPHHILQDKAETDKTEQVTKNDLAIHLMWNISSSTAPDLFLWFYSCVICPFLVFLELQSVSNSLNVSPFLLDNYNTLLNCNSETYLLKQSLSSPKVVRKISQNLTESKKKNINSFLTHNLPSASCYLLGNNSIAGSLGVGYPRHLKHEEALYEIAPEFREENCISKLSGIDVWCAGNPIPMYFTPKALSVVSGDYHTILLTQKTHEIYAWGCNQYGQCGVFSAPNDNKNYRWSTDLHPKKIIIDYLKFDVVSTVFKQKISNWMKNPFSFFVNSKEYNPFFTRTKKTKIDAIESTVENEQYDNSSRLDTAIMQPIRVNMVAKKPNDPFADVYAGATYSIARTASGRLWLWGSTWDGCLARESNRLPSPLEGSKLVKTFLTLCKKKICDKDQHAITKYIISRLHRVRKVAAGMFHVAALDCYGGLWLWGQSEAGQLGFGLSQSNNFALSSPLLHSQAVFLPRRLRVFILSLNLFSQMKLKPRQTTYLFSEPIFAKLRQKISEFLTALKIDRNYWNTLSPNLIGCRIVPAFNSILFSLTDQFLLDYSGLNMSHILSPSPLIKEELQFKLVSSGEAHTISVGVTYHGQNEVQWLLSWGQAKYGQLGIDFDLGEEHEQWNIDIASCFNFFSLTDAVISENDVRPTPCIVNWKGDLDASFNGSIMNCASGGCCNAIILDNNMVLVWGLNDFGALCFNEQRFPEIRIPKVVHTFEPDFGVVSDVVFSMGNSLTFFLSKKGKVKSFGKDNAGSSGSRINHTGDIRSLIDYRDIQHFNAKSLQLPLKFLVCGISAGIAHTVFIPMKKSDSSHDNMIEKSTVKLSKKFFESVH